MCMSTCSIYDTQPLDHDGMTQVIVKVVEAHRTNLHIRNVETGQKLKIVDADNLKLTRKLVNYVREKGVKSYKKTYGYSRVVKMYDIYINTVYTLEMTSGEVIGLLDVSNRNRNSLSLKRIREVCGVK
ncbi:MAG: hypothetical protein QW734_08525 [Candidatus Bathyarchaeia archaeon]